MAEVGSGQRMLATGRTADGAWLRVHFPAPGRSEGWVEAAAIHLERAPDSLPVAGCVAEAGAPAPVAEASSTITQQNSPSPPAAQPAATPTPTPPTPDAGRQPDAAPHADAE